MRRKNTDRGFSITEILIVIGLISMIAVFTVLAIRKGRVNQAVKVQADQVMTDLELAQSIAKKELGNATVKFTGKSSSATGYEIINTGGRTEKKFTFENGVYADVSDFTDGTVEFRENGSAEESGTITIRSSNSSREFDIEITDSTGLIKMNRK